MRDDIVHAFASSRRPLRFVRVACHVLYPVKSIILPLALGACAAKVSKLVFIGGVVDQVAVAEVALPHSPGTRCAFFFMFAFSWVTFNRVSTKALMSRKRKALKEYVHASATTARVWPAPLTLLSITEDLTPTPFKGTPLRVQQDFWGAPTWAGPGRRTARFCRRDGNGTNEATLKVTPCCKGHAHGSYGCKECGKSTVAPIKPTQAHLTAVSNGCQGSRTSLRQYNRRTRLVSTRVKIHGEGVHPEMIPSGYRERIAAVVAAAGQQLEGVYVREGCIELIVDTRSSEVTGAALDARGVLPLPTSVSHGISAGSLFVDQLVESLQLDPDQSHSRHHTAMVWQLPGPGVAAARLYSPGENGAGNGLVIHHASRNDSLGQDLNRAQKPTPGDARMAGRRNNDAGTSSARGPLLSVWPCAVWPFAPTGSAMEGVAASALSQQDEVGGRTTEATAVGMSAVDCSAPAAPDATDGSASTREVSELVSYGTAGLEVQVWWPLSSSEDTPPERPMLSARMGGVMLSVVADWSTVQIIEAAAHRPNDEAQTKSWAPVDDVLGNPPDSLLPVTTALPPEPKGHELREQPAQPEVTSCATQSGSTECSSGGANAAEGAREMWGVNLDGDSCGADYSGASDYENGYGTALSGRGCLFSGTCRIQDVPPGAGLLLLQAHFRAASVGLGDTRPMPVLCVDEASIAAEVLSASSAWSSSTIPGMEAEIGNFVVDSGVFLSGAARSLATGATVTGGGLKARQELLEFEELGQYILDWLCQTNPEFWPSTIARLRSELGAIGNRLRDVSGNPSATDVGAGDSSYRISSRRGSSVNNNGSSGGDVDVGDIKANALGGCDSAPGCYSGGDNIVAPESSSYNRGVVGTGDAGATPGQEYALRNVRTAWEAGAAVTDEDDRSAAGSNFAPCAASTSLAAKVTTGGPFTYWLRQESWLQRARRARLLVYDMYCSLKDSGYQDFLAEYCALQAPVLDLMSYASVGSIVVRTWQEEPQWRQRPLLLFVAHVLPCLATLAINVLSTITRPLLPHASWTQLVRACMVPRYLSFCVGLVLLGMGWTPPPAIAAYHQRSASVIMGEGVVLSATVVIMPATALLLAFLRIPGHTVVWLRVGAYDTVISAVSCATLLACSFVATNLLLHVVLLMQYRRRIRRQARSKAA